VLVPVEEVAAEVLVVELAGADTREQEADIRVLEADIQVRGAQPCAKARSQLNKLLKAGRYLDRKIKLTNYKPMFREASSVAMSFATRPVHL
jgi:hypothetical protein